MHRRFDWQYIYIYKKTRWFRTPFPTRQDQFSQKESGDSISEVQTFQKTKPPQFPKEDWASAQKSPHISSPDRGKYEPRIARCPPTFVFYHFFGLCSCSLKPEFLLPWMEVVGAEPKLNGKRWLFTNSSLLPGSFIQRLVGSGPLFRHGKTNLAKKRA